MKQTKRTYATRLFYDFRSLEKTLESMAKKGWKLKKLNNTYLEYERIDPQPLHYTVTYFSEASEFRPNPTENQQVFMDYCQESGWELVAKWTQMLIFCTQEEHPTPIDTDPEQQLEAMDKTMKKGMLPSTYVQLGTFLLVILSRLLSAYSMPELFYARTSSLVMVALFTVLLCYLISVPLRYFAWYRYAQGQVEQGGEIPSPKWSAKGDTAFGAIIIVGAMACILLNAWESGFNTIFIYAGFFLFFLLLFWITNKLRKTGLLAKVWTRVVFVVVLTVASTAVLCTLIFTLIASGVFSSTSSEPPVAEPLPLTLEDFCSEDLAGYTETNRVRESFLLKWSQCRQWPDESGQYYLDYEVYETDATFVLNHLLADKMKINSNEKHLDDQYKTNWRQVAIPNTTMAYQNYEGDSPRAYDYLLCFGTDLVEIRFNHDFTQAQVETAISILAQKLA